jgi:hypothetical protein
MNESYDKESIKFAAYGWLYLLAVVICDVLKLGNAIIPITIGWLLFLGRPFFFSATCYEDLGRLILSPIRRKFHPSTIIAKMRLLGNQFIPEASLDYVNLDWRNLPRWAQHEVGRHVLRQPYLFARLNFNGIACRTKIQEYFKLLEGVFTSGSLQDFIQAVRLFEAACYSIATAPMETSHILPIEQFMRLNEGTNDQRKLIASRYPTKWKIENLRLLAEKLSLMQVNSNGKYWLKARIRELESLPDAHLAPEGSPNWAAVSFT